MWCTIVIFTLQFLGALCLDFLFGDPAWIPHPVRLLGWLCTCLERFFRSNVNGPGRAGLYTVLTVLLVTSAFLFILLSAVLRFSPASADLLALLILSTAIACRDLVKHSTRVYRALADDLAVARQEVAKIVGRDTDQLDEVGVSRACVETVAENMVDGVTAPIFFALCFSLLPGGDGLSPLGLAAIGAYVYKTINTMDSMFGYKNERYLDFGRTAAKFDDLANFLPARITGLLLVPIASVLGLDGRGAWHIFRRDRLAHASPNSGHTEAAVAGALGIQLGGASSYFGSMITKPAIGDATRPIKAGDILLANRLMVVGSVSFAAVMLLIRFLLRMWV
jgi:adenosylcobinamide-phosphate synthase